LELEAHALEPFAAQQANDAALFLWLNGRNDEAVTLAKTLRPVNRAPILARIYASLGRFDAAADALTEISSSGPGANVVLDAIRLSRLAQRKAPPPQNLPRFPQELDFVYFYAGAPERMLDSFERKVQAGYVTVAYYVWHPSYASVRKLERFKTL